MNAISRKVIARAGWLLSSALALGIAWPSTALAAVQQTIWIPIGELPFVWVPVHKSPSLTWTGVPGASGYDVQVEVDGRVYQQHFDSPGAATLASFGLTPVPGLSYRFRVRAVSSTLGGGAWSPWMDDDGSFSPAAAPPSSISFTTTVGYDSLGNISSITHPTSAGRQQVAAIAQGAGHEAITYGGASVVSSVSYDEMRRPTSVTLSSYSGPFASLSGQSIVRTFDSLGRFRSESSNYLSYSIDSYDDTAWGFPKTGSRTTATQGRVGFVFSYGARGELDWVSYDGNVVDYIYDGKGNLTSHNGIVDNALTIPPLPTRTYDARNRDTSSAYDAAGRLIADRDFRYTYNLIDQPLRIDNASAAVLVEYLYDGDGQRVLTYDGDAVYSLRDVSGRLISQARYGYASSGVWGVLEEFDYVYLNGDAVMTATKAGTVTTRQYTLRDYFGSPAAVLDELRGFQLEERWYSPYGYEMLELSPARVALQFTGFERDGQTGLDYARARYYLANAGRFNRPDPAYAFDLRNPYGLNLYSYAHANPIALRDPLGLETTGEFFLRSGEEAASSGSTAAAMGWAITSAVWTVFGFEGISTVVDRTVNAGRELDASDIAFATLELATLGKGGGVVGKAAKTVGKRLGRGAAAAGAAVAVASHAGAGSKSLSYFSRAAQYGIMTYDDMGKALGTGSDLARHHLMLQL